MDSMLYFSDNNNSISHALEEFLSTESLPPLFSEHPLIESPLDNESTQIISLSPSSFCKVFRNSQLTNEIKQHELVNKDIIVHFVLEDIPLDNLFFANVSNIAIDKKVFFLPGNKKKLPILYSPQLVLCAELVDCKSNVIISETCDTCRGKNSSLLKLRAISLDNSRLRVTGSIFCNGNSSKTKKSPFVVRFTLKNQDKVIFVKDTPELLLYHHRKKLQGTCFRRK